MTNRSQETRSQKSRGRTKSTYFMEVVNECGITINDDRPIVLNQEQSLVLREINRTLKNHISYPDNAQEFVSGLKSYCQNENKFKKALMPTLLQKPNLTQESEAKVYQESLFRILLTVESLQSEIIEMLTDQIKDEAYKESEDTSWLRTLLNPLKYLPFIQNADSLTSKILDTVEEAHYTSQLEIINLIPDIVPDSQYANTATTLSRLMETNSNLTGAIIDCLNSLELSSDTKSDIQDYVLTRLTLNPSPEIFPILFEFVTSDCNSNNLQNVLVKARDALDIIMSSENDKKEIKSNKVLIAHHLQSIMLISKPLREAIIRFVSSFKVHTDHKPIDILLLLLLYRTGKNNKTSVENVFRKRIKEGLFRTSLVRNLLKNYLVPQTLKENLDSILEIAASLLRHQREAALHNFAGVVYDLLFNHEHIDRGQRQDILNNLILSVGTSGQKQVSSVLDILLSLSQNYSLLQEYVLHLMGLLELLESLEITDVGKVFDLLCSLTCGEKADNSLSGFKDELHMIIRKQLSSTKRKIKHQGIVAAVMMVKHLAITFEDQSQISLSEHEDFLTISDLPNATLKEAATLLELTNRSTLNRPEYLGLFYDQLASLLVTSSNLEKYFTAWLYESRANDFRNMFVKDIASEPINDIPFSVQFSLNKIDEQQEPIVINIAELTMRSSEEALSILTLCPLFRLVRLLTYEQNNGKLSEIDALLGCGVVMPVVNNINDFDSHQIKQIADCMFHCINWFREVINAFVTQKSRKLRSTILERLNNLIELEKKLRECLTLVSDYILPASYFDITQDNQKQLPQKSEKIERPRKRQKTQKENLNDTTATSIVTQTSKSPNKPNKHANSQSSCDINFRELDTDVIILLKYPIKLEELEISSSQLPSTQQMFINLKQFNFLVKDTVKKLMMLTKQTNKNQSNLTVVSTELFITDCVKFLPSVMKNFQIVNDTIRQRIQQCDIIDSIEMFTPVMQDLRSSFRNVLELIHLLLSWSGFEDSKNSNMLQDCLKSLQEGTTNSTERLTVDFSRKIVNYSNQCLCLSSAVNLIQILQDLNSISPSGDIKKRTTALSEKLLTKKWFTLNGSKDMGRVANLNIDTLIKSYLDGIKVETLCGIIATFEEEVPALKKKEDHLPQLQSINKSNFHIFYRCLCNSLFEGVKTETASLTNNQHLTLWKNTALAMQSLITIVKSQENKVNLVSLLKKSIAILKLFLSHGIPILEIMLKSKTDAVLEIFRIIQSTNRFLHHLCCASKYAKDISLVAYVPQFRLILESLLVRVKAALVANNCSSAFWMGTLRNRDLQGEDILTQSTVSSGENSVNNKPDDELPSDDDIEESDDNNSDGEGGSGSISDVF